LEATACQDIGTVRPAITVEPASAKRRTALSCHTRDNFRSDWIDRAILPRFPCRAEVSTQVSGQCALSDEQGRLRGGGYGRHRSINVQKQLLPENSRGIGLFSCKAPAAAPERQVGLPDIAQSVAQARALVLSPQSKRWRPSTHKSPGSATGCAGG
jgi:hypothetical protein